MAYHDNLNKSALIELQFTILNQFWSSTSNNKVLWTSSSIHTQAPTIASPSPIDF